MPVTLLPASAAAFAPRAAPNVVLQKKPQPWLTQALKRTVAKPRKRPLNNSNQQTKYLTELLAGPKAIWELTSLILPKTPKVPESETTKENVVSVDVNNSKFVHIEAYVVHVDMISRNEVGLKLTTGTIASLIKHHEDVFSKDTFATAGEWPEKEDSLKKLQETFVQAVNKFVFRTDEHALENLREMGAGVLNIDASADAKKMLMNLFLPLTPPPKPEPQPVRPAHILHSSVGADMWWPSSIASSSVPVSVKTTPSPSMTSLTLDRSGLCYSSGSEADIQSPSPMYQPEFTSRELPTFSEPEFYDMQGSYDDYLGTTPFDIGMPLFSLPLAEQTSCVAPFQTTGNVDFYSNINHNMYTNLPGYNMLPMEFNYPYDAYMSSGFSVPVQYDSTTC